MRRPCSAKVSTLFFAKTVTRRTNPTNRLILVKLSQLVPFQLNHPNTTKWMIFGTDFSVAVVQVTIDAAAPDDVRWIVGVGDGEALEDSELGFDQVEPRALGGSP